MTDNYFFSVGGIAFPGDIPLSLGPRHPTSVGLIRIACEVQQDQILSADTTIGYGHRGAEKLFEVRDYRSLIMLADRHDWLSAFSGELVVTDTVENAMRLIPPPRAVLLRTLLAEVARIHSHLSFASYLLPASEQSGLWEVVEELRQAMLAWTGNRVHPMLSRVGGLASDAPAGWTQSLFPIFDKVSAVAETARDALTATARFQGLGVLDRDTCLGFGLSGPVSRAAGLDLDRRATGYLAYGDLFVPVATRSAGDAQARFQVLLDELEASVAMVRAAAARLPETPGPVATRLARRLKVAEGEHVTDIEAPWGIASCRLVSRGGQTPWRLALRTPSFANVSALGHALTGHRVDQIPDVVASLGYTIGDLDK